VALLSAAVARGQLRAVRHARLRLGKIPTVAEEPAPLDVLGPVLVREGSGEDEKLASVALLLRRGLASSIFFQAIPSPLLAEMAGCLRGGG
jgi:hypothetical protein